MLWGFFVREGGKRGNWIVTKLTGKNIDDLIKKFGKLGGKYKTKKQAETAAVNFFKSRQAKPQRGGKVETVAERNARIKKAREAKAAKDKKIKEERAARKAEDKKRAEKKKEDARKREEEKARTKRRNERKKREEAEKKEARDVADIEAGTKVPVKGAGKSRFSTRETVKPRGTATRVQRQAGSKDPKTGEKRGGQFPKRGEAGAPGSRTRQKSEARIRARNDNRKLAAALLGIPAAVWVGTEIGRAIDDAQSDKKVRDIVNKIKDDTPVRAGPLRPDPVPVKTAKRVSTPAKDEKPPLTNRELASQFNKIRSLRTDSARGSGLVEETFEGKKYDDWKELDKAIRKSNKGREKPKDPVISAVKRLIGKKQGGSVPKKMYSGGQIRKPKRI